MDGEWLDIGVLAEIQDEPPNEPLLLVDAAVTARLLTWEEAGPTSRQFLRATLAHHLAARGGVDPARLARHHRGGQVIALGGVRRSQKSQPASAV
ncbi:hypothetical protein ACIBLA_28470 [Streptomyces sp. NPDC050433]|uniref:hypothetical protein n=1 Tax=unclassified Streptomyces TaxID=2593676 RepID=UPI003440B065